MGLGWGWEVLTTAASSSIPTMDNNTCELYARNESRAPLYDDLHLVYSVGVAGMYWYVAAGRAPLTARCRFDWMRGRFREAGLRLNNCHIATPYSTS